MAIFITQARFTKEGSAEALAVPSDRAEAVARLITAVEGKLIASYLTSGHVRAGRPAPYYMAPPLAPAPSHEAPAPPSTKREDASKTSESLQSHQEQDDGKSV
jgi:hypothetical protein